MKTTTSPEIRVDFLSKFGHNRSKLQTSSVAMGEESVWCWENTPAGKMNLLHITGLETSYGAPRYGAMSEVINLTKVVPRIFRPFRM